MSVNHCQPFVLNICQPNMPVENIKGFYNKMTSTKISLITNWMDSTRRNNGINGEILLFSQKKTRVEIESYQQAEPSDRAEGGGHGGTRESKLPKMPPQTWLISSPAWTAAHLPLSGALQASVASSSHTQPSRSPLFSLSHTLVLSYVIFSHKDKG